MTPHYMPRHPAGTIGAGLSRFWAVSGPGGGRTQPRPIAVLQPFSGARAPLHGQPNMCATEGAPGVPSSMVVEYIHSVSAVPSILVLTVSEPGHNLGAHGGKYRSTRLVEQQSNQSNINTDDNTGAKFSMSENYNTTKFSTNSSTADIQKPKDHHVADAPSKATLYKATRQSFHGRDATSQAQACHGCHDSGSHE